MCFMVMNHVHETNINVLVTNSGALIDYSFLPLYSVQVFYGISISGWRIAMAKTLHGHEKL